MLAGDSGTGLFLTPVTVPTGDPAALLGAAATYTAAHGQVERDRTSMTGTLSQADGAAWSGEGAIGFRFVAQALASTYEMTASALAKGASTLRTYAHDLQEAQATAHRANAAIADANRLATSLLGAQGTARGAQAAAEGKAQAATLAESQATAQPHSPIAQVTATAARSDAAQARNTATQAWNQASSLSTQYDAAAAHAQALIGQFHAQSAAAVKAAAGFAAAAGDLAGVNTKPVKGGAHGVTSGETAWAKIVEWNDHVGWGLNTWGFISTGLVGKAGVEYGEATSEFAETVAKELDPFVDFVLSGTPPDEAWAPAMSASNKAFSEQKAALEGLSDSVIPAKWNFLDVVGKAGLGVSMGSDVITEVSPTDPFGPGHLLGGNTDRVMAGLNFGASGLALGSGLGWEAATGAIALIPGGQIVVGGVLIGTALYFGGEFVYQHWGAISHGVSAAAGWTGHEVSSGFHGAEHGVSSAVGWVGHEFGL
jgi:hypothetical protein